MNVSRSSQTIDKYLHYIFNIIEICNKFHNILAKIVCCGSNGVSSAELLALGRSGQVATVNPQKLF